MTLAIGSRLGPYEILSAVGAGGMGEVYRAKDTRLDRTVAVKVLPAHLSENAEFRQRFEREARTISQLSHPHICTLHDVGHHEGVEYLVMEFLEGETLTERLAKGPLPLEQVLRHGIEIGDALEKAHRQGIVHRDLKPGNVMITKGGVKLVDFGLAKLATPQSGGVISSLSVLPTQAEQNLTAQGTILGTFQYMAPEQLEGRDADSRTDIFALGLVLYEMATGRKAFSGRSQASLIGSILKDEPTPISSIQPMTPPALDRVVKTCLAKDPDDRFQTAHDVKLQLQWITEGGSAAGVAAPVAAPVAAKRKNREKLAWFLFALAALAAAGLAAFLVARWPEPARRFQASLLPPPKAAFADSPPAVSPDGRRVAFVAGAEGGVDSLWIRPFDGLSAQPLAGTEEARFPFWSPDSRFLGFFANGKLKKIEASGGPAQTLADAPTGRGGTWSRDGVILFTPSPREPLYQISSAGGSVTKVTELDTANDESSHRWPFFLPGGRHYLFYVLGAETGERRLRVAKKEEIWAGSLDSKDRRKLLEERSNPVYAPGYLLFCRDNNLLAQPFDARRLQLSGEALPVAEQVHYFGTETAAFSASSNGVLAYQAGGARAKSQLTWLDRDGKQRETVGPPGEYGGIRLSHDGRRVALVAGESGSKLDIWIVDLERRNSTRFTFDPGDEHNAVWSPDDSRIVFAASGKGGRRVSDLYQRSSDGRGNEELLFSSTDPKNPTDWSADGRFIVFTANDPKKRADIWMLTLATRKAVPFLSTAFAESGARISPDARWLAYTSDESGKDEVYVQPFSGPGGKWQVSTAGGSGPRWTRGGRELVYAEGRSRRMSVEVADGPSFQAGIPKLLVEARFKSGSGPNYEVARDGRILANLTLEEESREPITLILNWTAGLPSR